MFHPWKCDNDPEENVLGCVSTTHIHQPDFFWPRLLTFGPVTLSPRSWRSCGPFEALAVSLSGWCDGSDLWTHTQVGALLRMSWTCKVWIWRVNPDPMLFSRFLFGRLQGPSYLIFMILVPFWLQKVKVRKQNQTFRQQDPLQGHSAPKVPKHPGRTRRAAFLCGGCRWDAQMLLGRSGVAGLQGANESGSQWKSWKSWKSWSWFGSEIMCCVSLLGSILKSCSSGCVRRSCGKKVSESSTWQPWSTTPIFWCLANILDGWTGPQT